MTYQVSDLALFQTTSGEVFFYGFKVTVVWLFFQGSTGEILCKLS